jgi:serine/threonine protein kinase
MDLKEFLSEDQASYSQRKLLLRTFFGCLSRAFQYLHNANIRHRDIKPANILICEDKVMISDFGLSLTWAGHSTTTWSTCPGWSRRYCAPEVAQNQSRNSSSDIWSLGCVFLEMVTVLKGRTVNDLLKFISANGTNRLADGEVCYHSEPGAITAWTAELKAKSHQDNEPIKWVNEMLVHETKDENGEKIIKRPSAHDIVIYTGHEGKDHGWEFCGYCCLDDTDDEGEDTGFNPTADILSSGVSIPAGLAGVNQG